MNIAIIPARGGSKRIPRKNIKEFCGRPMIAFAINAAKDSGLFDHIIVSTDDKEIANIAVALGAEVPFLRPVELACDNTATVPVIAHAIQECKCFGWIFDYVCCIYPGVPFIQIGDIKGALALIKEGGIDYCFPVTEYPAPIQRALKIINNNRLQPFYPNYEQTRTQDLDAAYFDAGQFYWGKIDSWLNNYRIYSSAIGYQIPNWRVVDIDNFNDWKRAELLYKTLINEQKT